MALSVCIHFHHVYPVAQHEHMPYLAHTSSQVRAVAAVHLPCKIRMQQAQTIEKKGHFATCHVFGVEHSL